jgi:hypothetical protein
MHNKTTGSYDAKESYSFFVKSASGKNRRYIKDKIHQATRLRSSTQNLLRDKK